MRVILAIAALLALGAFPSTASAGFYDPPAKLAGAHGGVIRAKQIKTAAALPGAKRTDLVLYRSRGVNGGTVAVSGAVSIPKGKAPKGGWPVISWAHGTTGIADQCAPTKVKAIGGPDGITTYAYPLFTRWLKQGWAVVRTDYEGLGTPGVHPYLVGRSAGRSVLDMALAASKLQPIDRKRVVIAGHSQGGHASLWANALAPSYGKALKIRGTVAFAPASQLGEQAELLPALTSPSGLTGLVSLILRGAEIGRPSLDVVSLLRERPAALYPTVDTQCLSGLVAPTSFGGIAPSELTKEYADISAVVAAVDANDPEELTVRAPLRVEQGTEDTTVFPGFTDQTVAAYESDGVPVDYDKVDGLNHGQIVTDAGVQKAATSWIAKRLK